MADRHGEWSPGPHADAGADARMQTHTPGAPVSRRSAPPPRCLATVSPGRWFATALMKLILAIVIVRYDLQLAPGSSVKKRPFGQYEADLDLRVMARAAA